MTNNEIKNIVKALRIEKNYMDAYFGFFHYGGEIDECYIKANRQGLVLLAAELLSAVVEGDSEFEKEIEFVLDKEIPDEMSDILFNHITLSKEKRKDLITTPTIYEETLKDKVFRVIRNIIGIAFLILAVIGLLTALSWL